MEEESYNVKTFQAVQTIAKHISRRLVIGGLAAIISLVFADKVYATYYRLDYARAASYIDSRWYYFLDYGQYYYLDRGQYNLIGKLGYFLGYPFYPKLYDKELDRPVGFTNIVNKGRFVFWGEQFPVSEYAVRSSYYINTEDFIYRRYYFSDKGQYNYLEKERYNLLGGLYYSSGRPFYHRQLDDAIAAVEVNAVPEPSTIGFLGLGALGIVVLRKKRMTSVAT